MKHLFSNPKKLFAIGGLALGLAGPAFFGGIGHAVAAPDTGTHDEMVEVHGDSGLVSFIVDDDGVFADELRGSTMWVPNPVS